MSRTLFVVALAVIVNGLQTGNSSNQLFCPRTKETHQYRLHSWSNVLRFSDCSQRCSLTTSAATAIPALWFEKSFRLESS